MRSAVLIDYGCHSFTYRLATHLDDLGFPIRYFANGSLESPNLSSLQGWAIERPNLVRNISCDKPYGKLSLQGRLRGELQWARRCVQALENENPSAVIVSCVPLVAVTRIQKWTLRRGIPLIYWLQDLQGRAIHELLGRKLGLPGRALGSFAHLWEQHILEKSRMVITIAAGHEHALPASVLQSHRYSLLENWANIEEIPQFPVANEWSHRHGIDKTLNIIYSGTLGLKHDTTAFLSLAASLRDKSDVRIIVVSSGHAAESLRREAESRALPNLLVFPFQPYSDVPKVLASASILIAPMDASAGGFCVPSKVLSYFCAGRPTVISIEASNPIAATITRTGAGVVVPPGDKNAFLQAVAGYLRNRNLRETAGQNARHYAEQTFSLERVTDKFLRILSDSNVPLVANPVYKAKTAVTFN